MFVHLMPANMATDPLVLLHRLGQPSRWLSGLRVCSPPLGGAPSAHSQEDVFAVLLDPVFLIDVGRVGLATPALDNIPYPVPGVYRVVALVTEEPVRTGIAIYAVVTLSADYRVVASPGVEDVRTS